MRSTHTLILAMLALCALPACVSSRLAEANLESVETLAQIAVAADEAAMPQAEAAVQTASDLVAATGTLAQLTSLGVPADLTDRNFENVRGLAARVVPEGAPEVRALAESAQNTAAEIAGKARTSANLIDAGRKTPIFDQVLAMLTAIGSGVGVIYAGTRGQKHVREWWKTPPEDAA